MKLPLLVCLVLALPECGSAARQLLRSSRLSHKLNAGVTDSNTTQSTRFARKIDQTVTDYAITLYNYQNVQYHGRFTLGNQPFPAIYDTGSFEILVLSQSCTSCPNNLIKYDSSRSQTFAPGDAVTAEHHFGSGSVTSLKGLETARIGPADSPLSEPGVHFWQIMDNNIAVWNEDAAFSGIIGLGHTERIPEGYGDNLRDRTFLAELGISTFAICLQRYPVGGPGMLVVNPSQSYSSPMFKTIPVVGNVHWGVEMFDLTVSGAQFNLCRPSCGAIVDSGTSLLAVPNQVLTTLSPLLNSIKEDCSNLHSLPSLEFSLGGQRFFLPPKAYVQQVQDTHRPKRNNSVWDVLWGGEEKRRNRMICAPAFMQMEKQSQLGPVIILGMPFLRYYYTIFNRDMKALHIAHANPDCTPAAQQSMMFSNFSNSTGFSGMPRAFDPEDFEPNKVSVEAMRAPDWAFSKSSKFEF